MSTNYFVMHADSGKEVTSFEAWLMWQLLKGESFKGPSAAKRSYESEMKNATDLYDHLEGKFPAFNVNSVSVTLTL